MKYPIRHEIIAESKFCNFCSEDITALKYQNPIQIHSTYYYYCVNCYTEYKEQLIAAEQTVIKNWIKKYECTKSSK